MTEHLKKLADSAIAQYNAETSAGGEPPFPAWAQQATNLLNAADAAVQCISELEPTQPRVEVFRLLHGALADARGDA